MGYGFKIGGRGIILRPVELLVYDGSTQISSLTIEGSSPTKTLKFTYIADNGKIGDGTVVLTSNSDKLTVSQTTAQKSSNEFTLKFNGMDTDEALVSLTLSVAETKHFLASETVLPVTLKRSSPTITLSQSTLSIVGGSPSGTINIASYVGDGDLTIASSDTGYATASLNGKTSATVTYLNGGKSVDITIGCKAGKYYKASNGTKCAVTLTKSAQTVTVTNGSVTIWGGGDNVSTTYSHSGLNGSTSNLGTLSSPSDNTNIATGWLSNGSLVMSYSSAGSTTIRIKAAENNYYYAAEASVSVSCQRSTVGIPSLSNTSVAWVGSEVNPGVTGVDWNLVNQTGTASANATGTYTVYWSLKNTTRYCWTDGTTSQKSQTWNVTVGTISMLIPVVTRSKSSTTYSSLTQYTNHVYWDIPYGSTWASLVGLKGSLPYYCEWTGELNDNATYSNETKRWCITQYNSDSDAQTLTIKEQQYLSATGGRKFYAYKNGSGNIKDLNTTIDTSASYTFYATTTDGVA